MALQSWIPYCACTLLPLAYRCGLASKTDFILVTVFTTWNYVPLLTDYVKSLTAGILIAIIVASSRRSHLARSPSKSISEENNGQAGKSLLIPCQTTHTRFFPKKHSFAYSYLQAGIPIGWKDTSNLMLSEQAQTPLASWFTVDPADYLDRGSGWLGLDGKLRRYLESEVCIEAKNYKHQILIMIGHPTSGLSIRLFDHCS